MTPPPTRQRWSRDQGSVAAETAIAVPVLLLLVLVIGVVIGRGVDARVRLEDAAHQAARAATLTTNPSDAIHAATATAATALADLTAICPTTAIAVDTSQFRPGGAVSVTLNCRLNLTGGLAPGLDTTRVLAASATSPIDAWRTTPVALSNQKG